MGQPQIRLINAADAADEAVARLERELKRVHSAFDLGSVLEVCQRMQRRAELCLRIVEGTEDEATDRDVK